MTTKLTRDQLGQRIEYMEDLLKGYRKINSAEIIDKVIDKSLAVIKNQLENPETPELLRKSFEERQNEWEVLKESVLKRNKELRELENQTLSKIPSYMECSTPKWTEITRDNIIANCKKQLQETVNEWEKVAGQAAVEKHKAQSHILRLFLSGAFGLAGRSSWRDIQLLDIIGKDWFHTKNWDELQMYGPRRK
ncbi:hypothetical protein BDU57DRAFT_526824 [Ampelomyces quisqualis]|uniref:Uncharacterized protein n=1 Tax=Ampelomyces quisqualis TaxID=50730 RepID=A0A6A5QT88_AMPQU|nr:hypothetical protein BDU57DRAFT_526824 [Ampelomyces quisqualis]